MSFADTLFTKRPGKLYELAGESIVSAVCDSPFVIKWTTIAGRLTAKKYTADLESLLKSRTPIDYRNILVDILAGINHIHSRGFIHCDVKPANILVEHDGQRYVAVVGDLGHTQPWSHEHSSCVYIPPYRPPEIDYYGPGYRCAFTPAADMYAIGHLMFVMKYGTSDRWYMYGKPVSVTECPNLKWCTAIFGSHTCAARPCIVDASGVTRDQIRAKFGLADNDPYDNLMIDLVQPHAGFRPTSEEALRRAAEFAGRSNVSPLPAVFAGITAAEYSHRLQARGVDAETANNVANMFVYCGNPLPAAECDGEKVRKLLESAIPAQAWFDK